VAADLAKKKAHQMMPEGDPSDWPDKFEIETPLVDELREAYLVKELAKYTRQADIACSLLSIYTDVICKDAATIDLF